MATKSIKYKYLGIDKVTPQNIVISKCFSTDNSLRAEVKGKNLINYSPLFMFTYINTKKPIVNQLYKSQMVDMQQSQPRLNIK